MECIPDKSLYRYKVDAFKSQSKDSKDVPFEAIDFKLYKPLARCIGFRTNETRLVLWINTFIHRYTVQLKEEGYDISWFETQTDGKCEKIQMTVTSEKKKLFTISTFLTTGRIQIQGLMYVAWGLTEFPILLSQIDELEKQEEKNSDSYLENLRNVNQLFLSYLSNPSVVPEVNQEETVNTMDNIHTENVTPTPETPLSETTIPISDTISPARRSTINQLKRTVCLLEKAFVELKNSFDEKHNQNKDNTEAQEILQDKITKIEKSRKADIISVDDKIYTLTESINKLEQKIKVVTLENSKLKEHKTSILIRTNKLEQLVDSLTSENKQLKEQLLEISAPRKYEATYDKEESEQQDVGSDKETESVIIPHIPCSNKYETLLTAPKETKITEHNQSTGNSPVKNKASTKINVLPPLSPKTGSNQNESILVITDSNGKYIKPKVLCPEKIVKKVMAYRCIDAKAAIDKYANEGELKTPSTIVIHVGTNDLEHLTDEEVTSELESLLSNTSKIFPHSKIIFSDLLPRRDELNENVRKVNTNIKKKLAKIPNLHFQANDSFHSATLFHDDKHLNKKGFLLFVKTLKSSIYGTEINKNKQIKKVNDQQTLDFRKNTHTQRPEIQMTSQSTILSPVSSPTKTRNYANITKSGEQPYSLNTNKIELPNTPSTVDAVSLVKLLHQILINNS